MDVEVPRSSRVKACDECRQQKLRCDVLKDPARTCARCRKKGLRCVISGTFHRVKRRTKSELHAELESLKQQLQSPTSSTLSKTLHQRSPESALQTTSGNSQRSPRNAFARQIAGTPAQTSGAATPQQTLPRMVGDVSVGATTIDDCFTTFNAKYSPQLPAVDHVNPNHYYNQSTLLFWSIVAIGSRKYSQDPTLIHILAPEVIKLAKDAALSRDRSIATIQALMLLCTWPMPFDTLSKDITPMLSGVMLQHAVSIGLHIFGVGQDFSRIILSQDRAQMCFRARLWALCIVVCQRISCTDGVPPVFIPDNYDHEYCRAQTIHALPAGIRFQKTLSRILTESILELERYALSKIPEHRAAVLNPIIDAASTSLAQLETECPQEIDRYYLICAELQILAFHLFATTAALDDSRLYKMHILACTAVEIIENLDQVDSFADYAPYAATKYLTLAAFTILKLSRCHLRDSLDVERGRHAYFAVISLCRKLSTQAGDVSARSSTILTQLWTSKNVFKKSDGTFDPLALRCGSRLAMCIVFDCYWWWRTEFAGLPNPYEDREHGQTTYPIASILASPGQGASTGLTPQADPPLDDLGWSWQESFPEFAWPTSLDMMSMDWPSQPGLASGGGRYTPSTGAMTLDLSTTWM